jgi:hypothetical protein
MTFVERRWGIGVAVCCAVFVGLVPAVCSAAPPRGEQANEPPAADSGPSRNARRWYGWQTLSVDGVAGALFLGAAAADHNTTLFGFSAVTFGFGAPALHMAHGNWELSLASVGLRIFAPFAGALVGSTKDVHWVEDAAGGHDSSNKWTIVGAGIGGLVAAAVDGLLFAYDTRVPSTPPPRNQLLRADSFPQLLLLRRGVGLGYSGQF